ncbi:hypothetical protein V1460_25115 [Streptomyces sp. SCSIO 30461]|uniref:hypothetical protein n=1 Tax=Streptomyces sp. SCSIO 30461 TaxID=3118085 RepID=UPI0030CCE7C3
MGRLGALPSQRRQHHRRDLAGDGDQDRYGREAGALLAWARADYDLVRKSFVNIQTGTTATGEALKQEVTAP